MIMASALLDFNPANTLQGGEIIL